MGIVFPIHGLEESFQGTVVVKGGTVGGETDRDRDGERRRKG